jgi:hypothetical protein
VNALIDKANELWDERNAKAVAEGEEELEHMLPLIRLKVHFPCRCHSYSLLTCILFR